MSRLELDCVSGLDAKAPAAFVVVAADLRLCLDLGRTADAAVEPGRIGRIDHVLLSHQHPDHAAGLDLLPHLGDPCVHATRAVSETLGMSARSLPLRGVQRLGPVTLTTGRSGHALGGAWLHLATEGSSLLYCGDVVPDGPAYPFDPVPPAERVILDASYGVGDAGDRDEVIHRVLGHPGPVLLPAPATGRGLEIAAALARSGRPPSLCRRTRAVLRIALAAPDLLTPAARQALSGLAADAGGTPGDVRLVSDPPLAASTSRTLAKATLDAGGLVLFTGHLAAGAPGRALLDRPGVERLRWPTHPSAAQNAALVRDCGATRIVTAFCAPSTAAEVASVVGASLDPSAHRQP